MATFVKGNLVQVCSRRDWNWDQWSAKHDEFCDKKCNVIDVKFEQWTNQLFIEIEHRGERLWFLDSHLIKVENYDEVTSEALHDAVYKLNETERVCKKVRDEILSGIFDPDQDGTKDKQEFTKIGDVDPKDWEEVTTKEVISLPGNGGTMTTPEDPKMIANTNRTKIRKIKSLGKKISKKSSLKPSGSLSSDWTLTDEEIEELQNYIDALPDNTTSTSGDFDINYDWDDGNAD